MRCRQSARLTPAPAIRINTSPAFGSGTGRVAGTSTSGPPGALISITVWVAGMLASTVRVLSLPGELATIKRQEAPVVAEYGYELQPCLSAAKDRVRALRQPPREGS